MTLNPDTEEDLIEAALDELDVDPAEATDRQRALLGRRIQQTINMKVLPFLNRDNFDTTTYVAPEMWLPEGADPLAVTSWQPRLEFSDRARVVSYVPNAEDATLYDVTFEVGLSLENPDAAPIIAYIAADAAESLAGHSAFPTKPLTVKSVSGGGQSMSWETRAATPDALGGKATIGVLTRFKRYSVGVSPTPERAPWPYGGMLP